MIRKILFAFTIGILFSLKSFGQEQRCNSYEYLQYLKANNPGYAALMEQSEIQLLDYIKSHKNNNSRGIITIPVVVHLLYNPFIPRTLLSDWQITSQIDAMNEDYRRFNADKFKTPGIFDSIGADCEIEFCLAKRDPDGNLTNGIIRKQTAVSVFADFSQPKLSSTGGDDPWPHTEYLNIWTCELDSPLLGYATFPSGSMGADDGVVIHCKTFGRINVYSKKYNEGRTATHEVGHWLNLIHVWGDEDCCAADDGIDDTPIQAKATYKCQEHPYFSVCDNNSQACNTTGDMFMNYMDYTVDSCMNIFTFGQKNKMVSAFNFFRSSLLSSQGCNPPSAAGFDIGVSKILNPDDFSYGDSVTPVVTIHNFGTEVITSADIYFKKNWGSHLNTYHWTGTLQTDGEVNVTLPKIVDSAWHNLFCAWTKNPNGNQDADTTNDFKTRSYIVSLKLPDPTNIVNIYPNPTGGVVTIDFGEIIDLKGTVAVYNVLGQMERVRMDQLSLSKFQIDMGNFPSGMYFLDMRVNDKKIIKKVIVQHEP